jgi:hypothetical protein
LLFCFWRKGQEIGTKRFISLFHINFPISDSGSVSIHSYNRPELRLQARAESIQPPIKMLSKVADRQDVVNFRATFNPMLPPRALEVYSNNQQK